MDISKALEALEALSQSPSTSSSGPLNVLLEDHFATARKRLEGGEDPKKVITDLQKNVVKAKKEVEKGLKGWYGALGNVGKAVEKEFPPYLAEVSQAYEDPPLFSTGEAPRALDNIVIESLGRRGIWDAVEAMQEEAGVVYDPEKRQLSEQLHAIIQDMESGDLSSAIEWCQENASFLQSPPHPSALPYHLHRSVFLSMKDPAEAVKYAREHLMVFVPTQPVLQLITSCLYRSGNRSKTMSRNASNGTGNGMDVEKDTTVTDNAETPSSSLEADGDEKMKAPTDSNEVQRSEGTENGAMSVKRERSKLMRKRSPYTHPPAPLIGMFRAEFCRRHEWSKEDPLEVAVDLGSRGGALMSIEKARQVMGNRLGPIRQWEELPLEISLPPSRRYHSVFVCPVSKEQATEQNPPNMLICGHVIAAESFQRLLKNGRRSAKCPYCPQETSPGAVQRLYF